MVVTRSQGETTTTRTEKEGNRNAARHRSYDELPVASSVTTRDRESHRAGIDGAAADPEHPLVDAAGPSTSAQRVTAPIVDVLPQHAAASATESNGQMTRQVMEVSTASNRPANVGHRPISPSRSQTTASSVRSLIRQAKRAAREKLAKRQLELRLQMEKELIEANLADEIEEIRSIDSQLSEDPRDRVDDWLRNSMTMEEPTAETIRENPVSGKDSLARRGEEQTEREQEKPTGGRSRSNDCDRISLNAPRSLSLHPSRKEPSSRRVNNYEATRWGRSPSPWSLDRRIEKLTSVMEAMARSREQPRELRRPLRQAVELPVFTGAKGEWLPFKAAYANSTQLYGIPPLENLARLQTCVQGEARGVVAALLYTAQDPDQIMATLGQKYGSPDTIIRGALEDLRKLAPPGTTAEDQNSFAIQVQGIVAIIGSADPDYLRNNTLVPEITEKLPFSTIRRWCDFADRHQNEGVAEVVLMARFLNEEAATAQMYHRQVHKPIGRRETALPPQQSTTGRRLTDARPSDRRPSDRKPAAQIYMTTTVNNEPCPCCGGIHEAPKCPKIKAMDSDTRWKWAKEANVCFKCLGLKHRRRSCPAKSCGVEECTRPHHPLLHLFRPKMQTSSNEAMPDTLKAPKHEDVLSIAVPETGGVLLKVCPVAIQGPQGWIDTYALLDEGSTITLIDEGLADIIGASGDVAPLRMKGIQGTAEEQDSRRIRISIKGKDNRRNTQYSIVARTVKGLQLRQQNVPRQQVRQFRHLKGLEEACIQDAKPRLLIGTDNWHLMVTSEVRMGKTHQPAAARTKLGWVIYGCIPRFLSAREDTVLHISTLRPQCRSPSNEQLDALIREHHRIDSLGITMAIKTSSADQRAIDIFNKTARRLDDQFEVGLPWREEDMCMPSNYGAAYRRLLSTERKMDRNPEYKRQYTAQIQNLLDKRYAELCEEDTTNHPRRWFLPHFGVRNPNKPEKLRLVFDAAAVSGGVCLNDYLLEGPDLLEDLPGILFRFREGEVAVTADIQEMFLRIRIRREDQPAQLFLWRGEDRCNPPRAFVMRSLIFGASSSPFLAHSVRNRNAMDYAKSHPRAYNAITKSHYMDDFVESFSSEEEALKTVNEVTEVHSHANFRLRGWSTNRTAVLKDITEELWSSAITQLGPNDKILGLYWDASRDRLGFNTALHRVPMLVRNRKRAPTKREALSAVMSLYDPLGLLSHFTITAKITLQQLWKIELGWDEPLPEKEAKDFDCWMSGLTDVAGLRLPRTYFSGTFEELQLHVFTDASEQAYATAAYWRVKYEDRIETILVAAKAKVAPKKAQTMPRMELQAALIGTRLAEAVKKGHRVQPVRTVFWTDSTTILYWIRKDAKKYTPFIAHRLGEIAESTSPDQWRWVPTTENVADEATRLNLEVKLNLGERWFTGPMFLKEEESKWPQENQNQEPWTEEDMHEGVYTVTEPTRSCLPEVSRFSKHERLIRATARLFQYLDNLSRLVRKQPKRDLELQDLQRAELEWLKQAQIESFPQEVADLQSEKKTVKKSSPLWKLDPVMKQGIVRLQGRIGAADVGEQVKRPAILDGRHPYVRLMIAALHERCGHANNERVVNDVRQRYYVFHLRPTVRSVAHRCTACRLRKTMPETPVKGDLPMARLTSHCRPFTHLGLDYFGPMDVTIGRRHEKRWGALFTCLSTRAIHLELVSSLSTDSAIMAIRRMAARRGWPRVIYSDNGTNFRGADAELQKAFKEWEPEFKNFALRHRIDWRFIPPGAPNQGGAWERLVRSVKTALGAVLDARAPKEEVLRTVLAEAEHSVNSRPLTYVPIGPDDDEALTPNHFLLGAPSGLPATGTCKLADRRAWRASQALADTFWGRWVREYLPDLVPRGASEDPRRKNLREGDVVIIADPSLPRNVWPRGVVERVYPGPDGRVRSADIKTRGGVFRRPTSRLAVLPVEK